MDCLWRPKKSRCTEESARFCPLKFATRIQCLAEQTDVGCLQRNLHSLLCSSENHRTDSLFWKVLLPGNCHYILKSAWVWTHKGATKNLQTMEFKGWVYFGAMKQQLVGKNFISCYLENMSYAKAMHGFQNCFIPKQTHLLMPRASHAPRSLLHLTPKHWPTFCNAGLKQS